MKISRNSTMYTIGQLRQSGATCNHMVHSVSENPDVHLDTHDNQGSTIVLPSTSVT